MSQSTEVFIYPLFGAVYAILGACSIIRCRRILRFEWRQAQSFYVLVMLQCGIRGVMLMLTQTYNGHRSFEAMQSAPESVLLLAYLMLFWQQLTLFYFAHFDHHFQDSFIRAVSQRPQQSSTSMMFLFLLMVWGGTQVALMVACLGDKVDTLAVQREVAVGNIVVPSTVLLCMICFQLKYSGIPLRGPIWRKKLVKMNLVLVIWSLGRMLSGALGLTGENQREESTNQSTSSVEIVFIILVTCEVLCIALVLDHGFLQIFEIEQTSNDTPMSTRAEPVEEYDALLRGSSPIVSASEVTVLQPLPSRAHSLGQLTLGRFRSRDVVLRRLNFQRVSNFVLDGVAQEIDLLQKTHVWGLLPCYGAVVEAPALTIVSPYMPKGSLHGLLHDINHKTRLHVKLEVCRQTARVMAEMAALAQHHGHLSSHNILLDGDFGAYVADFGLSRVKKFAAVTLGYVCKNAWTSPRLLEDRAATLLSVEESDDVYSFGMVLWEVLTEQEPFSGMSWQQVAELVCSQRLRPELPRGLPQAIVQLTLSCWNCQEEKRPPFTLVEETLRRYLEDEL